jgi:L-fucose isomerase-like protein
MNRRTFIELSALGTAAVSLSVAPSVFATKKIEDWNPNKPLLKIGKKLVIQPVLMYTVSQPKPQTSYKSWGGIQTDEAANEEVIRIKKELNTIKNIADFSVEVKPILTIKTVEDAVKIQERNFDVQILYPARGGGELLRASISKKKDNLLFVRKSSGPVYYWYEALSVRYLQTEQESKEEAIQKTKFVHVNDVIVDDTNELLWRLRALYGLKNFMGTRIIALGGSWGKYSPEAPEVAQSLFNFEIIEISYEDMAKRIKSAHADRNLLEKSKKWTKEYLDLPGTVLNTDMKFVENCFIVYSIFKDYMKEHETNTFTIRNCMNTIMPMSETTACLSLGLLNDEGYIAFCESDFVVIPPGVLLRHISGKPVFLHNSTFPHNGEVTCAHCIGPRRMDGEKYEPAEIMTHYESEYGAAPKVEMPLGQEVTFFDPQYSSGRWLGFKGVVKGNPYYEICRSQQDVKIVGNWIKLINEVRDSHWVMVYGDYLKEGGYAARKLNITWENISEQIG